MDRDIPVLLVVEVIPRLHSEQQLVREMLEQLEPQPVFLVVAAALEVLLELL
jgi:hypothetical protein